MIAIYATGEGAVPGAPPDGTPATTALQAPATVYVYLNGQDVGAANVTYSGINSYPGMWQINVQIPQNTSPSSATGGVTFLAVVVNGVANYDVSQGWKTVILVK